MGFSDLCVLKYFILYRFSDLDNIFQDFASRAVERAINCDLQVLHKYVATLTDISNLLLRKVFHNIFRLKMLHLSEISLLSQS